jgi:hypothetical protein
MKVKRRPRRQGPLIHALYINAGLLLAILVVLLTRGNGPGSPAFGAPQMEPIAGGGGVFLMPAQFSINTWGCYLMDIDTQNICAYQYAPGEHLLKFVAARNYREDRKLKEWNTDPPPAEIAHMNEIAKAGLRGAAADAPPAPQAPAPLSPPDFPDAPKVPSAIPTTVPAASAPTTAPAASTAIPGTALPGNAPGDSTKPANVLQSQPAAKGQ